MTSVTDTAPASPSAVARAMKDALFAALVAAGVFGPLLAFKTTQDMQNRLIVEPRWDLLAVVVLIVWAAASSCRSGRRRHRPGGKQR